MEKRAVVIVNDYRNNTTLDLDIPLDIVANDLIIALNKIFQLEIDSSKVGEYCLKAENPITMIHGNHTLQNFGIHHGTIINITN